MLLPAEATRRLRSAVAHLAPSPAAAGNPENRVGQGPAAPSAEDQYGADEPGGYPTTPIGWEPRGAQFAIDDRRKTRVTNYSGGYETLFPHRVIGRGIGPISPLTAVAKYNDEFTYRWGDEQRTVAVTMRKHYRVSIVRCSPLSLA